MNAEALKEIRDLIDDHKQIGFSSEISSGVLQVYQLNARNFWDLVVKDKNGTVIPNEELELFPASGQIKATITAGEVSFEYVHAGFTDAEIEYYYNKTSQSINKTALRLVELLLASAAKRFDYKAGIKDIKASQVFDHLKELRLQLIETIETETGGSLQGGLFVDRVHPAYDTTSEKDPYWNDVSRRDS